MNMQQIREKARSVQIPTGSKNKMSLIRAIQEKEGNIPCYKTDVIDCVQLTCCWRQDCKPGNSSAD